MAKLDQALEYQQVMLDERIKQHQMQPANDISNCIDCGEAIGEQRKNAVPHAMRCVGCQWQYERTFDKE